MIVLVLVLLFLASIITLTIVMQYRRSVMRYRGLAETLCDPGSWSIRFLIRMVILNGKVNGVPIRFSVLGSPHGEALSPSHLLLLCPVKINLRVYAGGDLSQVDEVIRGELEAVQRIEGFRSLVLTPESSSFLGKLLSRPIGFGYEPGILLSKLGPDAFNTKIIEADLFHLRALCKKSV